MSQHYSDKRREDEANALPDLEVWQEDAMTCDHCECTFPDPATNPLYCPHCGERTRAACTARAQWWWWSCFPGCLPDGEANGPFETEEEALKDARNEHN